MRVRSTLAALVALTAFGFGSVVAVSPAQAVSSGVAAEEPSSTVVESAALINGRVVRDAATAQRLLDAYWTPERMRSAVPWNPAGIVDDAALEQRDRPGNVGRPDTAARPAGPTSPGPAGPTGPSRNVVSTAAHCIHGGKGGSDHQNWMYAPLYNNGSTPHGKWPAKFFHATVGWTKHSYHWWDFAFVNVWPADGLRLVDRTGGNGISFNQSKTIPVTVLAYPSAAPYDGTKQIYCQAALHWAAAAQVKVFCGLTPGASGGAMFQNYDNDARFGFTNSVVAYVWNSRNYGPYFDSDVRTVYNRAKDKA